MGVSASKRNYKGSPSYAAPEALTADEQKQGKEENGTQESELESEEELLMKEIKKWKPLLKDVIDMKQSKKTIKKSILKEKVSKKSGNIYVKKGIVIDSDIISKFVSGDNKYLPDLKLYIGLPEGGDDAKKEGEGDAGEKKDEGNDAKKEGDAGEKKEGEGDDDGEKKEGGNKTYNQNGGEEGEEGEEGKEGEESKDSSSDSGPAEPMGKFDKSLAESISEDSSDGKKKLKKDADKNSVAQILTSIIEASKVANRHAVFRRIIVEYLADTKSLKKDMKEKNIKEEGNEIRNQKSEDSTNWRGKKTKTEVKGVDGGSYGGSDGGSISSDGGSISSDGGSISSDGGSISSDGGSISSDGGSISSDGGSISSDGGSISSDGDSISSDGGSISSDGGSISSDGGSISSSNDNNSLSGGRVGRIWRNSEEKLADAEADELEGQYKDLKKEKRAEFDEKKKAFFDDHEAMAKFMDENSETLVILVYKGLKPGKWINKDSDGNAAKHDMVPKLTDVINAYIPKPKPGEKGAAPPDGAAPADGAAPPPKGGGEEYGGGEPIQTGGAAAVIVKKQPHKHKKRMTRRKNKNKNINISINIGNQNDTSDSDTSNSDTSDSDSDDEEQGEKNKKYKRKGKYTINPIQRKKKTRRRNKY